MDQRAFNRVTQLGRIFDAMGLAAQAFGRCLGSRSLEKIEASSLDLANLLHEAADAADEMAEILLREEGVGAGYSDEDATRMALMFRIMGGMGDAVLNISQIAAHMPSLEKVGYWRGAAGSLREAAKAAINQAEYRGAPFPSSPAAVPMY